MASTTATFYTTEERVWRSVNEPGAPVYEWRDKVRLETLNALSRNAPVNSPLNRKHRPSDPGNRYRLGFRARRTGNQNGLGFVVTNEAPHAVYVELGRSASFKRQVFSWSKHGGNIYQYSKTRRRDPTHFMGKTVLRIVRRNA